MDVDLDRVQERFLAGLKGMISPHSQDPPASDAIGGFAPLSVATLLDQPEDEARAWVWDEYLAEGCLALLAAKPKTGKSTLVYELVGKVADGKPFLGRATKPGKVVVLALEEHKRDVRKRLQRLGLAHPENVLIHVGPLADTASTYHQLTEFIRQYGVTLVIVDTLNTFWTVQEENDAGQVTVAVKPLLTLARETGAAVLLVHHARKSEGEYGDEIRGSGALFSLLDVALILKRHEVENQRKLTAMSRYAETPAELLIELRDHGYESLGDPAAVGKSAKLAKLEAALADFPQDVETLAKTAGVASKAAYSLLNQLFAANRASRDGDGRRSSPYLFKKFLLVSVPKRGGPEETNRDISAGRNEPHPPGGGFVSSYPPFLRGKQKRNEIATETDSFLPTPVPPGSNELETDEEFIIDGGVHAT
jgi:hypothetical protein